MKSLAPTGLLAMIAIIATGSAGIAQKADKPIVQRVPNQNAASDVVTLRAVHPNLPDNVVTLVAEAAEPTTFEPDKSPELRLKTPREIAMQLCGSVTDAYFAALHTLNGKKADGLDPDQPSLDRAYDLHWPACLYVNDTKGTYTVLDKDNVPRLYEIFTGSTGSPKTWNALFAGSDIGPNNALRIGQSLIYNWSTRPTRLKLLKSRDDFLSQLNDAVAVLKAEDARKLPVQDVTGTVAAATIPISAGAQLTDSEGRISFAEAPECVGIDTPPFDPVRVSATYRFLRDNMGFPNPTRVLVVDNGFFGARNVGGQAQFGAAFKDAGSLFLKNDPDGLIGPVLKPGPNMIIKPINYENGLTAPDQLSGHGTHVLGLTLGGPGFDRSLLQKWLTIAVVAVSPGKDKLDGLSVSDIISAVGKVSPRIVNMSIEYSREQMPDLNLLTSNNRDRILFVVAAGNGYKSVEEQNSYPAMLAGGSKTQNILVVGATKGPAEPLVAFSNMSEEKVGTAAPGCRIRSWIGETDELVRMSGTSQSTPIVTFTSALVNSMMAEDAPPEAIRYRIQVSGDPSFGDAQTQAHTVTNVERALYVNYDYISYQPSASAADLAAPPIELIGELRLVPSWKPCMGIGGDQTWSFAAKPSETGLAGISILTGYQDGLIMPPVPCKKVSPAAGKGRVQFRAAWKLNGTDKPERVTDPDFKDIDIPLVNRFIRKGPGARIN